MKIKANPNEIQGKSKLISVLALLVICWEEVSTGWEPSTSESMKKSKSLSISLAPDYKVMQGMVMELNIF